MRPLLPGSPSDGPAGKQWSKSFSPVGSEAYLHLAGHLPFFVARVRATDHLSCNQQVLLAFDASKAHFFDPATGKALL